MIQADYRQGYRHKATLPCRSCKGTGRVQGSTCAVCDGGRTVEAGCGGAAEVDLNHPTMTYCFPCGHYVPSEEVTEA